jgi:hypothetical protein
MGGGWVIESPPSMMRSTPIKWDVCTYVHIVYYYNEITELVIFVP